MIRSNPQIVYEALTDGKMRTIPELVVLTGLYKGSVSQALSRIMEVQGLGIDKDPKWMDVRLPYKYYGNAKPAFANRHLSGWKLTEEEIKKWKEGKRTF